MCSCQNAACGKNTSQSVISIILLLEPLVCLKLLNPKIAPERESGVVSILFGFKGGQMLYTKYIQC